MKEVPWPATILVFALIALTVWAIATFTALLGPYGTPHDVYHLVILGGVFGIIYLLVIIATGRRLAM